MVSRFAAISRKRYEYPSCRSSARKSREKVRGLADGNCWDRRELGGTFKIGYFRDKNNFVYHARIGIFTRNVRRNPKATRRAKCYSLFACDSRKRVTCRRECISTRSARCFLLLSVSRASRHSHNKNHTVAYLCETRSAFNLPGMIVAAPGSRIKRCRGGFRGDTKPQYPRYKIKKNYGNGLRLAQGSRGLLVDLRDRLKHPSPVLATHDLLTAFYRPGVSAFRR